MASDQDLAELERRSNDYVPEYKAPLVGQRQSTQALVAEYAQADPVYIHKTTALPRTYSHYRTIRGDGNCGWRALAFGYFEALLRQGDSSKILAEAARLKSFNTLLDSMGWNEEFYEDFVHETLELLKKTATSIDDGTLILDRFNDQAKCSAITYHFKLITSAWMRSQAAHFADFVPDRDVKLYCAKNIEAFTVELDNLGLQALATAIVNKAGIAIDVLYLDRSEGEEVTPHQWPVFDADNNVLDAPTIRLLYRPGHYDLLYKAEDISDMSISSLSNPEIRLVSNPTIISSENPAYSWDMETSEDMWEAIPGFSYGGMPFAEEHFKSEPISPIKGALSLAATGQDTLSLAATAESPLTVQAASPRLIEPSRVDGPFRITPKQQEFDEMQRSSVQPEQGETDVKRE
ncbi:hypothetical protein MMC28_009676 [Mycoblastus sanguinarius]|nr:hypothetical protein [Mycoblastus sanguinarius]